MSKLGFDKVIGKMEDELKKISEELSVESRNEFLTNYDTKTFNSTSWPHNISEQRKTPTGNLKSALENSITQVDQKGFKIIVNNPYGSYLNEGTENMEARKFVGQTEELTRKQISIIEDSINKIFE